MTEKSMRYPNDAARSPWVMVRVVAACAASAAAIVVPKLALPAVFFTLVCFLALPKRSAHFERRWFVIAFAIAGAVGCVAVVRFVVLEAVPGIVQGGKDAAAKAAVSRLRELVFAEDAMRTHAFLDADGDGVGSAGLISELSGARDARSGRPFPPILNGRYRILVETRSGSATNVDGYLYMICLPRAAGGFTARSGEALNEELAERRFLAYAWPSAPTGRIEAAFAVDEHERILVSKNVEGRDPHYVGPDFPPDCEAALRDAGEWQTWMNKKPRSRLPGDRAAPR